MAEPHDRKPILTIEQQIEHLKQKGVAFELCSEEEAADYLRDQVQLLQARILPQTLLEIRGRPARRPLRRPRLRPAAPGSRRSTRSCATPCSA